MKLPLPSSRPCAEAGLSPLVTAADTAAQLLFMGNKKYPVENAYQQYISAHSGLANAYTSSTSTNFHFELSAKPSNGEEPSAANPSPLLGALDRFAQFFIEPLFLADTLDRELLAVDSENKKNLQSDQWRLNQLKKSLSNHKHPFCHFSTGNLETLKAAPEARGINVRDKFIEFYEKHYSANRMKLCVLGREPLDVLQSWVVEHFSAVRNKELPPNRWPDEVPFTREQLGTQVFMKPVMDMRELTLTFPFMEQDHLYETLPGRYISHLIGHEGPGSIMAYIKSKGWANNLSAGAWPVSPGTPELFECQISLTEEVWRDLCIATAIPKAKPAPTWLTPTTLGTQKLQGSCQSRVRVHCPPAGDGAAGVDIRGAEGHGRGQLPLQGEDAALPLHQHAQRLDAQAAAARMAAERVQPAAEI